MGCFVALLRGINVSGQKKIIMAELRDLLSSTGLKNIETYIQSGNIIFDSVLASEEELAALIHKAIKAKYGFEVSVLVRNSTEISKIPTLNPYLDYPEIEITNLHVTFLHTKPDNERRQAVLNLNQETDKLEIVDDLIFLYCPLGYGRSKLSNVHLERASRTACTTRNWKTILKLNEIISLRSR